MSTKITSGSESIPNVSMPAPNNYASVLFLLQQSLGRDTISNSKAMSRQQRMEEIVTYESSSSFCQTIPIDELSNYSHEEPCIKVKFPKSAERSRDQKTRKLVPYNFHSISAQSAPINKLSDWSSFDREGLSLDRFLERAISRFEEQRTKRVTFYESYLSFSQTAPHTEISQHLSVAKCFRQTMAAAERQDSLIDILTGRSRQFNSTYIGRLPNEIIRHISESHLELHEAALLAFTCQSMKFILGSIYWNELQNSHLQHTKNTWFFIRYYAPVPIWMPCEPSQLVKFLELLVYDLPYWYLCLCSRRPHLSRAVHVPSITGIPGLPSGFSFSIGSRQYSVYPKMLCKYSYCLPNELPRAF
jgi:hypothetical protein